MSTGRRILSLLLIGMMTLSVAACSQPVPPTPTVVSELATPVPAMPIPQSATKTVRIGMSQEPDSVVNYPGGMYVSQVVQNLLFNELVSVDDQMQPFPDLAERVPTLENGGARWIGEGDTRQLEVTFKLRKNVLWSDGEPFTARDVKFSWELMLNPNSGAAPDTEIKYESVEVVDDHTVVFTLFNEASARASGLEEFAKQEGPVVDPLYLFGLPNSFIYPAHVLAPLVDNQPRTSPRAADLLIKSEFARNPVGTGPYTLRDWTAGTSLTLRARPDYFRGPLKIDTAVFTIVPKSETLIAQLQAGDIDVITADALDTSHAPILDKINGVKGYYIPGTAWEHIDLNLDDPILEDRRVRQALYYAIDRQELVDRVLAGKTEVVHSVIMDWSWAYNKDVPFYEYDPERANQLLEEAGWKIGDDGIRVKDGRRLTLTFQTTDAPMRMRVTPLVKDHLKKIGFDVIIDHMPGRVFFDRTAGPLAQRTFQMAQYAWVGGYDPGADSLFAYASRNIPSDNNNYAGGNYPGYASPESDRLLAEGLATLDAEERARIYRDWQSIVMRDLPTLPLFARPHASAASKRLTGFRPGMSSIGETWNIHEWDLAE